MGAKNVKTFKAPPKKRSSWLSQHQHLNLHTPSSSQERLRDHTHTLSFLTSFRNGVFRALVVCFINRGDFLAIPVGTSGGSTCARRGPGPGPRSSCSLVPILSSFCCLATGSCPLRDALSTLRRKTRVTRHHS